MVNTMSSQILRSPRGCCVFPGRDVGSKRSVQTADINKHGWHISTSHYCTEIKPQIPEISAAIWWCHLEPDSAQQRSGCGAMALSFQLPNSIMSRIRLSITPPSPAPIPKCKNTLEIEQQRSPAQSAMSKSLNFVYALIGLKTWCFQISSSECIPLVF